MTTISTAGEDDGPTGGGEEESDTKTLITGTTKAPHPVMNGPEKRKPRGSVETVPDEESLRLIKELQKEEYGLRRRERV